MDLQQLEEEARQAALKEIKNMLQRPGQLEKVDQFRHRVARKKASVEALLKTGMQNQLDGVRVGLKQLETCLQDVKEVRQRMQEVDRLLEGVPDIYDALEVVREENTKHSQYATAMENLKHIFNVEASVSKTMNLIDEDKLLNAHQCLADLENSRDDLLYELHKQPKQHASDKITLKRHFETVDNVSQALEKKLRLILSRTLNTVRKEPTVIVTALRIIEREEKNDQFALQQQKVTGFLPPGRPKKWRAMALNILQEAVVTRIEGSKLEERADNKMWLVRDLEILRQIILEDLRVVKSLCVPCFPPHYNIFNEYVKMYHEGLSSYLDNIAKSGLEGNEYVSMLSWVMNTYPGVELMSHPDLRVDIQQVVGPLLRPEHLKSLEDEYLRNMQRNYQEWMTKTADTEKQEWFSDQPPEQEQYYHTSAPVIIFQMIDQHLQVTNTIHSELTFKALVMSIQQVEVFGQSYLKNVIELKEHHFRNRDQIKYFTHYIITIVNNSQQMVELAQQMKQLYWPKSRTEHYEDFEKLLTTFQRIRAHATNYLLEEAFLDMECHFNDLFTLKWLGSTISVDTICVTLLDYFQDYKHLRPINFEMVINEAQKLLAKRYIRALLSKRLSKSKSECEAITTKIKQEAKRFKQCFEKIAPNLAMSDSPLDLISTLSELLSADIELLVLDLHTLLGNYPSFSEDHIVRLFYLRNDVKASEVREKIQDATKSKKAMVSIAKQDCIFKEIVFNDKLW
ncbi:exocyst complex component 3 [Zeugodacus cucurbitae]|uniref:Exocyst complex component 3 n=1 Tax=Zeugodacus cucurbitae TaxID=28588 RepID=A0A0A1XGU6_ZEUCU|nr:exocyst complex component 3 [Zeugodacus cucurbitae]XP_054089907.1 exocyst complex component 3 [Zeugodacus cucurbitae]XP_054089908.1 exocyst complex component 3 [Zeugodacus cucurbitae]